MEITDRIGPYRIVRTLGHGGQAVVYLVEPEPGVRYAMKVLTQSADPDDVLRFRREVEIGQRVKHPNVCNLIDAGESPRYMVMEYLEGETLDARIGQQGVRPLDEARQTVIEVLHGLSAIHGAGVVHRDLKPDNVFLTTSGAVKIIDFGISHRSDVAEITKSGIFSGTLVFTSPEQLRDAKHVDFRTDLFNVGLIFYYMLSGHLPYEAPDVPSMLMKLMQETQTPLSEYRSDLPPAVHAWLSRMLSHAPEDRFKSARSAITAILF